MSRMSDSELVLRIVALADRLASYKLPLRQFLNEYMRDHRLDSGSASHLLEDFRRIASITEAVFGEDAFRRFISPGAQDA
jgi:hypothetical protein